MKDVNIGAVDTGYSYKWRIPGQGRQEDENTVTVAKRDGRGGGEKRAASLAPFVTAVGFGGRQVAFNKKWKTFDTKV